MSFKNVILSCLALTMFAACSSKGKYASSAEWVANSKQGNNLILAEKAGVWSEGKMYTNPLTGRSVQVKTNFTKHYGTTCVFDVEFKNVSDQQFGAGMTMVTAEKKGQFAHRVTNLNLAPGKGEVYEMELRECTLQFGESQDLNLCASCDPVMAFMGAN